MIDCGTNEDLFLAIAALRDDLDRFQWFTNGKEWIKCEKEDWIDEISSLCVGGKYNYDKNGELSVDFHKATVEELIKHFEICETIMKHSQIITSASKRNRPKKIRKTGTWRPSTTNVTKYHLMMSKLDDVVEDIKELLFSHNTISLWLTKDVCVYVGIKNSIDLGWYADKIMVYNINKNKQYHVAAEYIKNQIDMFMKEYNLEYYSKTF